MTPPKNNSGPRRLIAGFTLPAVLVIVAALLILVVGLIALVGIERRTARSYVDLQRADLAAKAALEEVRGILGAETANDEFLIISGEIETAAKTEKDPTPYLYLVRASGGGDSVNYRYLPLFSADSPAGQNSLLTPPQPDTLVSAPTELETLPWFDPAKVSWIPVKDDKGRTVSRYAYWVEDLQSKVNARTAGNNDAENRGHGRSVWPYATAKPLNEGSPQMSVIAPYALDPQADDEETGDLNRKLIDGRDLMLSPGSVLAAAGFRPPLARLETGLLEDPVAASVERNTSPVTQPYTEQAIVPFAPGISSDVSGQTKLNLNRLLNASRASGIGEFAGWIDKAMPDFQDERKGGFPENYLETLAANAFDYADPAAGPTIQLGAYRGVGSFPMLSELLLKYEYTGPSAKDGQLILNWHLTLFAEFWNMTNRPQSGEIRLSYEVGSNTTAIGSGTRGKPFDDPSILDDPTQSGHALEKIGGKYFTPKMSVSLEPDEYRFYQFASVTYSIPVSSNNVDYKTKFSLVEFENEARGVTVQWNGKEVDRIPKIVRDPGVNTEMEFTILNPKLAGKAAIPGHSYGPYGEYTNNMGDPRIAYYIRNLRLGENSIKNLSPNRRNIRRTTVYDSDSAEKRAVYGRVLPSEWPDGGHDAPVGSWQSYKNSDTNDFILRTDPTDPSYLTKTGARSDSNAPQRVSRDKRFYSATELGHVYDPLMWSPAYTDVPGKTGSAKNDTTSLLGGFLPGTRNAWPDVGLNSNASGNYGGGNTLRIGRPEHSRFHRRPGTQAAQLLDLFHAGIPNSSDNDEIEGTTAKIDGQINVNTAGKDALRAMMVGLLTQDPQLKQVTNWSHSITTGRYSPTAKNITLGTPTQQKAADLLADAIIFSRPFGSAGELAATRDRLDRLAFGNPDLYTDVTNIQWSDSAAEEVFARLYDASTFRSRNFRVWVIGQSLGGPEQNPEILSESRKVYTLFSDPGKRAPDGGIKPENFKIRVMYENNF